MIDIYIHISKFCSWKLDEFGTTQLNHCDDGETTYVVLVDMHS